MRPAQCADGGEVVRRDHGRRYLFLAEDGFHSSRAAGDPVVARDNPAIARRQPQFHNGVHEGLAADARGDQPLIASDEPDVLVPKFLEVAHKLRNPVAEIDGYITHSRGRAIVVGGHHRNSVLHQRLQRGRLVLRSEKCHPVHPAKQHTVDRVLHA